MRKIEVISILLIFIVASVFIVLIPYAAIAGDHLHKHSCNADEILRFNGMDWECSTDYDTLYALSCDSGQVAKWDGSEWVCADDEDTNTDTLISLDCSDGEIAKWKETTQMWECAEDKESTASLTTIEQLRMIRGTVDSDGTILAGQGFSVDWKNVGGYTITVGPPPPDFDAQIPTIVVTPYDIAPTSASVSAYTDTGKFNVHMWSVVGGDKINSAFNFILVWPQ
jgi:hypothetical protein